MSEVILTTSFILVAIIGATVGASIGGIIGYSIGKHLEIIPAPKEGNRDVLPQESNAEG